MGFSQRAVLINKKMNDNEHFLKILENKDMLKLSASSYTIVLCAYVDEEEEYDKKEIDNKKFKKIKKFFSMCIII